MTEPGGVCECGHGPAVHPPIGPCQLIATARPCGCRGWQPRSELEAGQHHCHRAEVAEAAMWTVLLLGRWSGDKGRSYPVDQQVKALRLLGRERQANALAAKVHGLIPRQTPEDKARQRRLDRVITEYKRHHRRGST